LADSVDLWGMEIFAGGLSSAAPGPLLVLGGPKVGENVSLAADDVAGGEQVLKHVLRWVAWIRRSTSSQVIQEARGRFLVGMKFHVEV
jgi:hypothetical protein